MKTIIKVEFNFNIKMLKEFLLKFNVILLF